jgi:ATP-binding cassette subfamily B protein
MEPKASSATYRAKVQQAEILAMLQEDVQGQTVVKAFRLQGMLIERFKRKMISFYRTAARATFLGYMTETVPGESIALFNLVTFGAGCFLTFGGYLTVGQLLAFQVLLNGVTMSVGDLTWGLPQLIQASAGMQRIKELLEEKPEVTDAPDAVAMPRFSREITLKRVKFRYGGDRLNLDDVSMTIPAQSKVAFVGPSGCGKSTVLNLLMRFYDPDEGSVSFDGMDIRGIAQNSLRNQISMVSQDSFLYDTSIRENIRMGSRDASDAAVEEAAKVAEIHDIIEAMPEGYDTLVGEGGSRLSGGQRQRVAIARAIIGDPALLVLDEATSALDPGTAMSIKQALARITRGRTVIFVTHHLESALMADLVFVFDEGRLVEQGHHEQLLQDNGLYARLWGKQTGFSIDQKGNAEVEVARLRDIPIFNKLDDTLLTRLAHLFSTEHYVPDRVVIHEGEDPADRFYIIVRGQVALSRRLPEGVSEQIAVFEDGDYFGSVALLRKVPRMATARALSDCTLLSLAGEHFQWLMEDAPELHKEMEEFIEEQLRLPEHEWAVRLLRPEQSLDSKG